MNTVTRDPFPPMNPVLMPYLPDAADALYCVYHHEINGVIEFVGSCRLRQVFECPDARRNNEWKKRVFPAMNVMLRIVHISFDDIECRNHAYVLIQQHRPYCSTHGYTYNYDHRVLCINTSTVYPSASAAARVMGISGPQLINHLNNRPGYRSVKGMRFTRMVTLDPSIPIPQTGLVLPPEQMNAQPHPQFIQSSPPPFIGGPYTPPVMPADPSSGHVMHAMPPMPQQRNFVGPSIREMVDMLTPEHLTEFNDYLVTTNTAGEPASIEEQVDFLHTRLERQGTPIDAPAPSAASELPAITPSEWPQS